ncbi:flagellar motor switch protein FliN [bacterium 3DAC]|nr:flagellar motor switch protein FliN [bacterium 3DAC]
MPTREEVWKPLIDSLADVLQGVLGKSVTMNLGEEVEPSAIESDLGKVFYASYNLSGDLSGSAAIVLRGEDALNIANLMLQVFGMMAATLEDDMVVSTLAELANQMISAFTNTMAGTYGKTSDIEPVDNQILSVDEIPDNLKYFAISTEIEGIGNTTMYIGLSPEVVDIIESFASAPQSEEPVPESTVSGEATSSTSPPAGSSVGPTDFVSGKIARGTEDVQEVDFAPLQPADSVKPYPENLELLLDVNVTISVEIGRTKMTLRELLSLGEGSIIQLDKLAGEPMNVLVNGKVIARGEVVVIDESFGVRILEIVDKRERLMNV